MHKHRLLIILYDKNLLNLIIAETTSSDIQILDTKRVRIFNDNASILRDKILQVLKLWQEEVGIKLVEEEIILEGSSKNKGVDDIFIFSPRDESSLEDLTDNLFVQGKDVKPQGAVRLAKQIKFKNLLFVSFDMDLIDVTGYRKDQKGKMTVVNEKSKFNPHDILKNKEFLEEFYDVRLELSPREVQDKALNFNKVSPYSYSKLEDVFLKYKLLEERLGKFLSCKKLKFGDFGKGRVQDNLLVLSGEDLRLSQNMPVFILAVLNVFNLNGNFQVIRDDYDILDHLQRSKKKFLFDKFLNSVFYPPYGVVYSIEKKGGAKIDDIAGEGIAKGKDGDKKIIPMYGKIHNVNMEDIGEIQLDLSKKYTCCGKKDKIKLKSQKGEIIFDVRPKPIDDMFKKNEKNDLLISWMKGVGAADYIDL